MRVFKTIDEMRAFSSNAHSRAGLLGLVPTMGALHAGHGSLVRAARERCDVVAASIFVNPAQFGPAEDFAKYPRDFEQDCAWLERDGADAVFAPSVEEMYPPGATTWVTVEGMSDRLCGRSRPGHFRGVTTVVSQLFHIVEPEVAFFGQKDAAQVAIIRRMARDLHLPVKIEVCPIVREPDGLALSSRNAYLDPQQRKSAPVLYRALCAVKAFFDGGERDAARLIRAGKQEFSGESGARLDYLEIVDPDSLEPIRSIHTPALVAVAAWLGSTRLIDNIVVNNS